MNLNAVNRVERFNLDNIFFRLSQPSRDWLFEESEVISESNTVNNSIPDPVVTSLMNRKLEEITFTEGALKTENDRYNKQIVAAHAAKLNGDDYSKIGPKSVRLMRDHPDYKKWEEYFKQLNERK